MERYLLPLILGASCEGLAAGGKLVDLHGKPLNKSMFGRGGPGNGHDLPNLGYISGDCQYSRKCCRKYIS